MSKKYPKISIVTPSYNQAGYLERTIKSVLNQGYPNIEYIIIDGGSTDGSIDIIKKYVDELTYWVSEPDIGLYDALSKGFSKSSGEIMGWLNSDDLLHDNSLYTLAQIFNDHKSINWLGGAVTEFDEAGRTVYCKQCEPWSKYRFYRGDYKWIQQESTYWRRSLWEKAGGKINNNLKYAGDFELWVRFFRHDLLYNCDALIGGFRQRGKDQITTEKLDEYLDEVEYILDSEPISNFDRDVLNKLNKLDRISQILRASKILNMEALQFRISKRRKRLMNFPRRLRFDRTNQNFIFSKSI